MKNHFTTSVFTVSVCILFFSSLRLSGQYCSPTFVNGCFSWNCLSTTIDAIEWELGAADCSISDYTTMSTTVEAGSTVTMNVVSGAWCGCAIWIDLNNDFSFDETENMYHKYVGGSPSFTYDSTFVIPALTPTGSYRMRLIAPWGSDGFLESANGFGPCGEYQYGNFLDFTIHVVSGQGLNQIAAASEDFLSVYPNPVSSTTVVEIKTAMGQTPSLVLYDVAGRHVMYLNATVAKSTYDWSMLDNGIYFLIYDNGIATQSMRVLK